MSTVRWKFFSERGDERFLSALKGKPEGHLSALIRRPPFQAILGKPGICSGGDGRRGTNNNA